MLRCLGKPLVHVFLVPTFPLGQVLQEFLAMEGLPRLLLLAWLFGGRRLVARVRGPLRTLDSDVKVSEGGGDGRHAKRDLPTSGRRVHRHDLVAAPQRIWVQTGGPDCLRRRRIICHSIHNTARGQAEAPWLAGAARQDQAQHRRAIVDSLGFRLPIRLDHAREADCETHRAVGSARSSNRALGSAVLARKKSSERACSKVPPARVGAERSCGCDL